MATVKMPPVLMTPAPSDSVPVSASIVPLLVKLMFWIVEVPVPPALVNVPSLVKVP